MRAYQRSQQGPWSRPASAAEEKRYGKAYDARVVRRLWPFMAPYASHLLLATACMLGVSLSHLLAPYLVKLSLDRYIAHADVAGLTSVHPCHWLVKIVSIELRKRHLFDARDFAE